MTPEEVAKQSVEQRLGRIIGHLRDIEEVHFLRFQTIPANDDPRIYADPSAADRSAEDRQYLRNDAAHALAAFWHGTTTTTWISYAGRWKVGPAPSPR
jgi:hypothetical protein